MAQYGTDANSGVRHGSVGAGLRNVGSYQISGHPFITGSILGPDVIGGAEHKISFPLVTKKITVIASGSQGAELRIHFSATGSSANVMGHYISLDSHEDSVEFDVKCKEIYISSPGGAGGYMLYASLTSVPTGSMYDLSAVGPGLTE